MRNISSKSLLNFTSSMSALLNSSLQLQDAISLCRETTKTKEVRQLCSELNATLNKGEKLNTALKNIKKGIPPIYTAIVQIGEESAKLPLVFAKLSDYLEKQSQRATKIKASLIYPLTVLSASIILCAVILFYVFPRMADIFTALSLNEKNSLPDLNMLTSKFIIILSVVLLVVIIPLLLHKNCFFREIIDSMLLRLPFIKESIIDRDCENYTFAMELLSESGLPLYKCMQLSDIVIENVCFRKNAKKAAQSVCDGRPISESFEKAGNFPPYMIQWLNIGEKTGNVTEVFKNMHTFYEKRCENGRNIKMTVIEPLCILITGGIVAALICNFVLPIFNIMGDL